MGAGAMGFGAGLLEGLAKNIATSGQDEKLRAILEGDVLGLSAEAGMSPDVLNLGGKSGGMRGVLEAFGLMQPNQPAVTDLLRLRGQLQGRARQAALEDKLLDKIEKIAQTGSDLSPVDEARLVDGFSNPLNKMRAQDWLKRGRKVRELMAEIQTKGGELAPADIGRLSMQIGMLTGKMPDVGDVVRSLQGAPRERPFGSAQGGFYERTPSGEVRQLIPPAPRSLSPREEAFQYLTPEEQRQALLRPREPRELSPREKAFQDLSVDEQRQVLLGQTQTTTETERTIDPLRQRTIERAIAARATEEGVYRLSPTEQTEALRRIAEDYGVDLEGEATVNVPTASYIPGGRYFAETASTLRGRYNLRPKPLSRKTARGRVGQPSQKRLRFDAQGNLIGGGAQSEY